MEGGCFTPGENNFGSAYAAPPVMGRESAGSFGWLSGNFLSPAKLYQSDPGGGLKGGL